jgi:hypothetical protein
VCPGTELNRYGHCCPQDFKSCVSTNSTTGACLPILSRFQSGGNYIKNLKTILQRTVTDIAVHPDFNRGVSTNSTTGACLPILSRFQSGGNYIKNLKTILQRTVTDIAVHPDFNRGVSTNSTTGACLPIPLIRLRLLYFFAKAMKY